MTISVIDDDAAVRWSIQGYLRSVGCDVSTFESLEQFLASPTLTSCSCVISDINFEDGLSGMGLKAILDERGLPTPVILITGLIDAKCRSAIEAAGGKVLKKPFSGKELFQCVMAEMALRP